MRALFYVLTIFSILSLTGCATVYYPDSPSVVVRPGKGIYHIVQKGQTLWGIAQAYDVDIDQITLANDMSKSEVIKIGDRIFIPGATKALAIDVANTQDLNNKEFEWPSGGEIVGYFQGGKNDFWTKGIKIQTSSGENIVASRTGEVVFSDELMGYGSTVIVDHQDGFMSVYANNGQRMVGLGETVKKGSTVAQAPSGEGKFIYFEIRRNGKATNPLFYLPKG